MPSPEIKGIAQCVWDAAFGSDDGATVIADALQVERDRSEVLLDQRDALIARLEIWEPRALEAEAELERQRRAENGT